MKQFETGKNYYTRSACNHECIFKITITKRTAKTVTFTDGLKTYRRKIDISTWYSEPEEMIHPYGVYSMAPVIKASDDHVRP